MDWERTFGGPLDYEAERSIASHDWSYTPADQMEVINELTRRLGDRDFSIANENTERWQKGWKENLDEFRATGKVEALNPRYLRPARFLRLESNFICPADPQFETNWYQVFRGWFARRYLAGFDAIYEFGAGSGHNVAYLAQAFPQTKIIGLDWTDASFEITQELAKKFPNVSGGRFDFFNPCYFEFPKNSAVLTIGALEQTGRGYWPFMEFLLRQKPAMCFHIEPIMEWYDWDNLVDHTAIEIHKARGFQQGFVREVGESRSTLRHRTGFGSLLLEGYSQLAWKP